MNTKVLRAYRFALDPNGAQRAAIRRHAGAARFAFTWGLARVKAALAQRDAERSYGLDGDALTLVPWTLPALRLAWNTAKNDVAPVRGGRSARRRRSPPARTISLGA
ncbi:helix-turn-helix domain-containing protein [Parafrankia soli]|uniref:helix-turn-helix domain-containing protein n=1 Tax=Parafrankia soli TaxID=2599596 RepID=UPI000AB93928